MRRRPSDPEEAAAGIAPGGHRHGLARVLSRLGLCSRAEAARRIRAGRVAVDRVVVRDPDTPADPARDAITLDGRPVEAPLRIYAMLHKPRGIVVTAHDERGRDTIYDLLGGADLPWLAPVGRLDRASEGLLLLTNDPAWAARITDPASGVRKTYRVQVRGRPDPAALRRLCDGIVDRGERLAAESVGIVGGGERNTWCEVVLCEGRNREIRRMVDAIGCEVLRLIRIGVGPLALGALPRGAWRRLSDAEAAALARRSLPPAPRPGSVSSPAPRRRSRSRPRRGSRPPR